MTVVMLIPDFRAAEAYRAREKVYHSPFGQLSIYADEVPSRFQLLS